MDVRKKISVVIPTYNREVLLLSAIQSVLDQTYAVHEILVCDDGSTDQSKHKVVELNNPKIKWIDCGKNGMPARPRNMGIAKAEGDLIAFCDSDDEWVTTKLEKQVEALEKKGKQMCCTNAIKVKNGVDSGKVLVGFDKELIELEDLVQVNWVITSSVLIGKSLLNTIGGFPEDKKFKVGEDYVLWLKASLIDSIVLVNEDLVFYLDEPQQSIRSDVPTVYEQKKFSFDELSLFAKKINRYKEISGLLKRALFRARLDENIIIRKIKSRLK